ncbi:hypothetical protein FB645_000342 [Coemansia sp. IMI 203386]|nr:hypothetical protein FB645_000342 [Coemansia sp. IMI 203386]
MSLNFEQQTTYTVRQGLSFSNDRNLNSEETPATDPSQKHGFHLLSRQLPRTTTKLSRELLDNGSGLRTRFSGSSSSHTNIGKKAVMLEADSKDQKATCTYEGEFELITSDSDSNLLAADDDGQEVDCVLIYDEENKAFIIERVTSNVVVKSGAASGVNAASSGAATGLLALPSKKHDPSKEKSKDTSGTTTAAATTTTAKRDVQANMDDESSEDELAKELEGMLDDVSDMGDPLSASSARQSRKTPVGKQKQQQQQQNWENMEDQLNMELAENLDKALLEDAASDDDDFEEVDSALFASEKTSNNNMGAEVESLVDGQSDDDEDDEMVFEEVDPSVANIGTADNGGPQDNKNRESELILEEEDFEDFEEIGSPRTAQSSAFDDALFGGSVASTPPTGDSMTHPSNTTDFNKPADGNAESADDFVEVEFD